MIGETINSSAHFRSAVRWTLASLAVAFGSVACASAPDESTDETSSEVQGLRCPSGTRGAGREYGTLMTQVAVNSCERAYGAGACKSDACGMPGGFTPEVSYAICCGSGVRALTNCLNNPHDVVTCGKVVRAVAEYWDDSTAGPLRDVLERVTGASRPTRQASNQCNRVGQLCPDRGTTTFRCPHNPRCAVLYVEQSPCARIDKVSRLGRSTVQRHECINASSSYPRNLDPVGLNREMATKGTYSSFYARITYDTVFGRGFYDGTKWRGSQNAWWGSDTQPTESLCNNCFGGVDGKRADRVELPPPPAPTPDRACDRGSGSWCTNGDGRLPDGYDAMSVGARASFYLTSCPSRGASGTTKTCYGGCYRAASGAPDDCR